MTAANPRKKLVEAAPHAAFDLDAIVKTFPETAETLLIDTRPTDEDEASARVFRVYHPTPAHYHVGRRGVSHRRRPPRRRDR
jgi:hypothetical protein